MAWYVYMHVRVHIAMLIVSAVFMLLRYDLPVRLDVELPASTAGRAFKQNLRNTFTTPLGLGSCQMNG